MASHLEVGQRIRGRGEKDSCGEPSAVTDIATCAGLWAKSLQTGMQLCGPASALGKEHRAITVRYEDLVLSTELEMRRICDFLKIRFEPQVQNQEQHPQGQVVDQIWVTQDQINHPIVDSSIGRWRRNIPDLKDRVRIAIFTDSLLVDWRYSQDLHWVYEGIDRDVPTVQTQLQELQSEFSFLL